jgi:hypothetical protein
LALEVHLATKQPQSFFLFRNWVAPPYLSDHCAHRNLDQYIHAFAASLAFALPTDAAPCFDDTSTRKFV